MKALFKILPVFLLFGLALQAQDKKIKCEEAFKAFEEKVNTGDFDAAHKAMPELRLSCRGFNEDLYKYGELVLKTRLESARTEEAKLLLNDLVALYTEYYKYYPKSDAPIKKAMLLHRNKLASNEEVFALLDAAFNNNNNEAFTGHDAIETYYLLYLDKFKAGDGTITADSLVEKYGAVSAQARMASGKIKKQVDELVQKQKLQPLTSTEILNLNDFKAAIESLAAVNENIDVLTLQYLNCGKLEEYYAANYERNAQDVIWLDALVNTLVKNKCYKSEVVKKSALALHQLEPTPGSAFNLALIAQGNNDSKEAGTYLEEAAQLEHDPKKKADLYYRVASSLRASDRAAAKKYALLSANLDPAFGKPYLFLAELYASASADCHITPFEQKALMWLAIETLKKAETAEARYKPTVASMVKSYSERLPSKQDIKGAGKRKGDKITYGCWINETVTIPNL